MAIDHLLDASALLALFQEEPGCDVVEGLLDRAAVHAVQVAEVAKKFIDFGFEQGACERWLARLNIPVIEKLSLTEAVYSALFIGKNMSLGDRICLTVGRNLEMTVVTADQPWRGVVGSEAKVLWIR